MEPPFKLQGSYRNMNRIAEKIISVMNDEELERLIHSHYESESQTLTTSAEANLLKFKELTSSMNETETKRWEGIKKTFNRNLLLAGAGGSDRMGQVLLQMETLTNGIGAIEATFSSDNSVKEGLRALQKTLSEGIAEINKRQAMARSPQMPVVPPRIEAFIADDTMHQILRLIGRLQPETSRDEKK